ncbi:MAG TPA: sulfotransferase family protein [Gammaproteobacteria bacterium]|nr:sulfotransferase family protein [Gammaproteobacteria bacterium]
MSNAKQLQLRKQQAIKLIKQGLLPEAEAELVSLTHRLPKDKVLWRELGRIRINQGRHTEAMDILQKAVILAPKSAETHFLLGMASLSSGRTLEAIKCLEKSLKLEPKNIESLIQLGYACTGVDNEKAIQAFKKAKLRQADNIAAVAGLAGVYTYKGDIEAAYKLLTPLLQQQPIHVKIAIAFADIARPLKQIEKAIDYLNTVLTGRLDIVDKRRVHFLLGRLYDQQGEYDQAFKHYKLANSTFSQKYNPSQDAAFFNGIKSAMTQDFFSATPCSDVADRHKKIIFIVGMPRSGTTLVEQILSTRESVYAAGELGEIGNIAASIPAEVNEPRGYPDCLQKLDKKILNKLSSQYQNLIEHISPENSDTIIDKMPDNFRFLGFIQLLFPNAKIIHCRRDPMDTSLSCYFQNFAGGHLYSNDLYTQGAYYRMYEKLMEHWKSVLDIPIMDIKYEELIENPLDVSRNLMSFCELEWDANCLRYFENTGSVVTASFDQVRQPIYHRSVGRWKNYQRFLEPLEKGLSVYTVQVDL